MAADKQKKIAIARTLFNNKLDKLRDKTWTAAKFRGEVIAAIMEKTDAPMNSAATMYQLIKKEAENKGELKGVDFGRPAKAAAKPKTTAKPKAAKPKTAKAPAIDTDNGDGEGTWEITDGTKTLLYKSRDRVRAARAKLGDSWTYKNAAPNASVALPAST